MTKEFISQIFAGKMFIEASITFLVFMICWVSTFYLGVSLLKVKVHITRFFFPSLIMALFITFRKYVSDAYIVLMIVPVFLMLLFIIKNSIRLTRRNLFFILAVSVVLLVSCAFGDLVIGGLFALAIGKENFFSLMTAKCGFYALIIFSFFEMSIPAILIITKVSVEKYQLLKAFKFEATKGLAIFLLAYFIFSTFILDCIVSLRDGGILNNLTLYQLIAALSVFILRHKMMMKAKNNYESRINALDEDRKRLEEAAERFESEIEMVKENKHSFADRQRIERGIQFIAEGLKELYLGSVEPEKATIYRVK
jgi:hypothetical protein